jgi:hypothetical protein
MEGILNNLIRLLVCLLVLLIMTGLSFGQSQTPHLAFHFRSDHVEIHGVDPQFGMFGAIHEGAQGNVPFFAPGGEPVAKPVADNGTFTATDGHSHWAGWFSNPNTFAIAGFAWLPDQNVDFLFNFSDSATFITAMREDGSVEGWYADPHFIIFSFIAKPNRIAGKVVGYDVKPFTIPGAEEVKILVSNQYGRAGSYRDKKNGPWIGFMERDGGLVWSGSGNDAEITAVSRDCFAADITYPDGKVDSFVECRNRSQRLIRMGAGNTVHITAVFDSGECAGWVDTGNENSFGFVTAY